MMVLVNTMVFFNMDERQKRLNHSCTKTIHIAQS